MHIRLEVAHICRPAARLSGKAVDQVITGSHTARLLTSLTMLYTLCLGIVG